MDYIYTIVNSLPKLAFIVCVISILWYYGIMENVTAVDDGTEEDDNKMSRVVTNTLFTTVITVFAAYLIQNTPSIDYNVIVDTANF